MSLWNDFWDFVDDTVHDVGDTLEGAWHSIKDNPIGAITSAVAMAYGIPPAWAGALGGAAGAASTGGNIVKAAITGGAMGYMGAAAGAAAGTAGTIAQAAAAGTAASVTGAILTGQDVLTAAKQGLILGAVSGGVVKLMTPSEAIQAVPTKSLADLTATSSDPLGDLIGEMGWTDSDSARAAASQAFSKNAATTQTMLQESIPDYVLKAASQSTNPAAYIADELGWNPNSITVAAAERATNAYKQEVAQQETAAKVEAAKPINQLKALGVDADTAQTLVNSGIDNVTEVNLVKDLMAKGYAANDIVDLQSAGVDLNGLKNLSTNVFNANQIDNMLTKGVSINDISSVSANTKFLGLPTDQLENLLSKGADFRDLSSWKVSGQLQSAQQLLDNGVSADNINSLRSNGWDVNKLASQVEGGYISGDEINNTIKTNYTRQGINSLLNDTTRLPTPEEIAQQQQLELQQQQQAQQQAQIQAETQQNLLKNAQQLSELSGGRYTPQEIIDQNLNARSIQFENTYNNILQNQGTDAAYKFIDDFQNMYKQYGEDYTYNHLNEISQPQPVQPEVTQPGQVAGPVTPGQSVDVSNITQEQLNQLTQENNPYMNSNQGTSTAGGYTPEQQEMYTRLRESGYGVQEAMDMVTNGTVSDAAPTRVDVTGTPGFAENPNSAIPEYRTPNTDLATQQQIDNGEASFNQAANAWEVTTQPVQPETPVAIVPPVVPPTTTVPEIPTVEVTAPRVETPQPVTPIITPPTTVAPTQPVVQPPAPVAPTQPTVVSSSTRTTSDGSVYKDDQYSDGTTTTVLVSGPVSPSGQTSTGGTTNPNQPLTPPKQEVIPPDTSYVAPVEVTPPPVDTTTPPVEQPPVDTTPFVPMIPPTGTTPEVPPETRGHYTLGAPIMPNIPTGLNPGYITNVPNQYQNTNPAQSKYYWGAHPYQSGNTFDRQLYTQSVGAPVTPWGATHAQTAATPQQILQAMGQMYPLLNSVSGPVQPTF